MIPNLVAVKRLYTANTKFDLLAPAPVGGVFDMKNSYLPIKEFHSGTSNSVSMHRYKEMWTDIRTDIQMLQENYVGH